MASDSLRVAVIGAGVSGIAAIKCCLDEGITPVCFERTDRLGGLWHYTEKLTEGQACVMKSTIINTSKEMMSFSDFPIPEHFPNFMNNSQILEYLKSYCECFDLERYISYETDVTNVIKADDYLRTGRWEVTYRNISTGEEKTEKFAGVLVCSGYNSKKLTPNFPGLGDFQGKVLHSNDYRVSTDFMDKRVVVVGIGNSAGDVAVDLSHVAKQVFLSTRRGTWVLKRVSDRGYPFDLLNRTRFVEWLHKTFHGICEKREERRLNGRFDHQLYR
ncbi:dimethylaniline monooxygenase [n-oxide-forming] [Plakobranchus ocellatus]|uniref:Flavin-containing monooxygenase n=1 Tax=Plakobranchus ocellatus TaxID=259542 RepID=A0AAV4CPJ0_9GAST|nr:dimethylaniline monooxygenase [n-oxide-forming] [Plakobranchus ocellatus]